MGLGDLYLCQVYQSESEMIVQQQFEVDYYNVAVKHIKLYTKGTSTKLSLSWKWTRNFFIFLKYFKRMFIYFTSSWKRYKGKINF